MYLALANTEQLLHRGVDNFLGRKKLQFGSRERVWEGVLHKIQEVREQIRDNNITQG